MVTRILELRRSANVGSRWMRINTPLRIIFSTALLTSVAVLFTVSAGMATDLHLVCLGAGSANKTSATSAFAFNNQGQSAWGEVVGKRAVPFDDQVNVDITEDGGRIRMPRTMLPTIHGGDNGWMEIKNLKVTEQAITGSVGVSFVNHPKMRIDRLTGNISLDGKSGHYRGDCQAYDPSETKPKF